MLLYMTHPSSLSNMQLARVIDRPAWSVHPVHEGSWRSSARPSKGNTKKIKAREVEPLRIAFQTIFGGEVCEVALRLVLVVYVV